MGLHGCKLVSLDDPGGESPMGMFVAELRDAISKFELATILERTNRGKRRKIRTGKILRTAKPPYGFRYTDTNDGLIVHEPEMRVVERVHRWAAEGLGPTAIRKRLHDEGVPSPTGNPIWNRPVIKRMVLECDLYLPYTVGELVGRVEDEVRALHGSRSRLERLAANKESVLEHMAGMASVALEHATSEDRRNLYKMLQLRVTTSEDGYELEGAFCGLEPPSTAT
ncbi:MAG: recombinase family protein [Rubrobacter sp.]|nr:recombinase family protein [Rubrobacter sp.]MDQ3377601.1 recombinase family protein [Actinomycetota bacterium]